MFSRRRIHDKYTSWKKLFMQNWTLFKASRIGLVGLAIMIGFVIIAFLAPFMGLRDPLYWLAPESDTIQVAEWWPLEVREGTPLWPPGNPINGSVDYQIGFRLSPAAFDARADRIYVAEGHRLIAVLTSTSNLAWSDGPIEADARISTAPVVINYGDHVAPAEANFSIFFGTEAGTVYAARDAFGFSTPVPASRNLGSPITALAAFSNDQSGDLDNDGIVDLVERDSFVVGTEDGRVFAYTVNPPYAFDGFYRELWNISLAPSSHVHVAGSVIKIRDTPISSPAFYYSSTNSTRIGQTVFLGTGDGRLWSLYMSDGTLQWSRQILVPAPGTVWQSAPVVSTANEVPSLPSVVYAAGRHYDASTNESISKLFVLYADTGDPLDTWAAEFPDGGIPIGAFLGPNVLNVRGIEREEVHTPAVSGANIFVTSESGWLYSVGRDPVLGANDAIVRRAGSVSWAFRDESYRQDGAFGTYFASGPHLFQSLQLVVVAGNYNNGTADRSDDRGIVYVFGESTGSLTWKKSFGYAVLATPSVWRDPGANHPHEAVWFGTVRGDLYSYSSTGLYLAPVPPSWTRSGGYPSGEYYILGTDARGRDIFSQLIWGSRIALLVGFASAFFSISIGVIIGLVAGYLGGRVESILMRFTDVILVIPGLPLVIILAAVLGAGIGNIILVIAIVGWPGVARIIRAEVLSLKERPFIDSARVTGASNVRIMFRHVAPNVAPLAFLYMTFAVSGAILTEAALSFIGLGDVNTISWGIMLQDVSQSKALQAWWWLLPPGLAITLISLAFFLVGRAFDEIVNPRLRKR